MLGEQKLGVKARAQAFVDLEIQRAVAQVKNKAELLALVPTLYSKYHGHKVFGDYTQVQVLNSLTDYFRDPALLSNITRTHELRTKALEVNQNEPKKENVQPPVLNQPDIAKLEAERLEANKREAARREAEKREAEKKLEAAKLELERLQNLANLKIDADISKAASKQQLFTAIEKLYQLLPSLDIFPNYTKASILDSLNKYFNGITNAESITRAHGLRDKAVAIREKMLKEQQNPRPNNDVGPRTALVFNRFRGENVRVLGMQYPILTGQMDFATLTTPVVSAGAGIGREAILIDPNSKKLQELYQEFTNKLQAYKLARRIQTLTTREMMDQLIAFAQTIFTQSFRDNYQGIIPEAVAHGNTPIIRLEEFIRVKRGCCRHHSALVGFLAGKLIQGGVLIDAEVYGYRENTTDGAHQVVIVSQKDHIWFLDSLNYHSSVKITNDKSKMDANDMRVYRLLKSSFSARYVETAEERYKNRIGFRP